VRAQCSKRWARFPRMSAFSAAGADRVWTRDSGCIFLPPPADHADSGLLALAFSVQCMGQYPNYKLDEKSASTCKDRGARVVHPFVVIRSKTSTVVLEGGSIDVNGRGTLITTEEVASTTQQRKPGPWIGSYEQLFADYFGAQSVIWLDSGTSAMNPRSRR